MPPGGVMEKDPWPVAYRTSAPRPMAKFPRRPVRGEPEPETAPTEVRMSDRAGPIYAGGRRGARQNPADEPQATTPSAGCATDARAVARVHPEQLGGLGAYVSARAASTATLS